MARMKKKYRAMYRKTKGRLKGNLSELGKEFTSRTKKATTLTAGERAGVNKITSKIKKKILLSKRKIKKRTSNLGRRVDFRRLMRWKGVNNYGKLLYNNKT